MKSIELGAKAVSEKLARAAAHPIRVAAFSAMAERPHSAKEIAEDLGEPVPNVSYHVRELAKLQLIELVRSEPRRGATERFYRATVRPMIAEKEWSEMTTQERENCSTWIIQSILIDISRAVAAKTFDDRDDRHLSRMPLLVDEQGWRELTEIHTGAMFATIEVQARSALRELKGQERNIMAYSAIALFEGPKPA